jgi:hypothetical protein
MSMPAWKRSCRKWGESGIHRGGDGKAGGCRPNKGPFPTLAEPPEEAFWAAAAAFFCRGFLRLLLPDQRVNLALDFPPAAASLHRPW